MTNSVSRSRNAEVASSCHYESITYPGVSFTIRQMTLRHRIKLLKEVHDLYREAEFSTAGSSKADRLNAQLSSLRVDEVFLRWGVIAVEGLVVDGRPIAADEVGELAPECLASEMLSRVRECMSLSSDEEKN